MQRDLNYLRDLVSRPSESLTVEIKNWLDLDTPAGISKVVKTAFALRNFNGGYLIFGFDDKTISPLTYSLSKSVREAFHPDKIQGAIARYASDPFSVDVDFVERDGQEHPIVVVPSGVKVPVVTKSDLIENGKKLIAVDEVYFRSINASNTPASTKAAWKDWPRILDICFDNREADVARFIRRYLPNLESVLLRSGSFETVSSVISELSIEDQLTELLDSGAARFNTARQKRDLVLPSNGSWEIALIVKGTRAGLLANTAFLQTLATNNPQFTGWPVWLDSRSFREKLDRPYVVDKAWEAFIVDHPSDWGIGHVDFMRLEPAGRFYLWRALQDDLAVDPIYPASGTMLDFGLPIIRTAEALAVGLAFAKALTADPISARLAFAFRWSGLSGRELSSWAQPGRHISPGRIAAQDQVVSIVEMSADTPASSLSEYVGKIVQPLFEIFEGFELSQNVIDDLVQRLLERRL